jgi:hypothetical protein
MDRTTNLIVLFAENQLVKEFSQKNNVFYII